MVVGGYTRSVLGPIRDYEEEGSGEITEIVIQDNSD